MHNEYEDWRYVIVGALTATMDADCRLYWVGKKTKIGHWEQSANCTRHRFIESHPLPSSQHKDILVVLCYAIEDYP